MIEDRINPSVPEIIIQSFWFWCCIQTRLLLTDVCSSSPLGNFGCIGTLHKVIWLDQVQFLTSLVVQISKKSLWRECCVIFKLICSPANWAFGNTCCRDVRGGYDWWNFYSGSILKRAPVIHLFMLYPKKKKKKNPTHRTPQHLASISLRCWMWS